MALSSANAVPDRFLLSFRNPNRNSSPLFPNQRCLRLYTSTTTTTTVLSVCDGRNLTPAQLSVGSRQRPEGLKLHSVLIKLVASAIVFVGVGARACSAVTGKVSDVSVPTYQIVQEVRVEDDGHTVELNSVNLENHNTGTSDIMEDMEEDEELRAALESWKSKTYALTVSLRVVALRGSIPPSWIKSFIQSQGRRLKLQSEFRGSLNDIFSDLFSSSSKGNLQPRSAMAADIITVGDSWLSLGIKNGLIEPIHDAEQQDWFTGLSEKWKVYLRRNSNGELDSNGKIWAAPYRWGGMVIAYKKNKFQKHNMAPIEDWGDLWRPELAGKISMVDSPREVVGAVLKYMGASYNTEDIDTNVTGGKKAAMQNLGLLQKQVRLFDSAHYLKAFAVGDVWVAVGWSSDIIPAAKRMSNVAVIVPQSGTSLWADLWAVPAASKFATSSIGGRIRGPSPLIHQWIGFCLQAARALPFQQEVIPGAAPFALDANSFDRVQGLAKGKPKLDTNLIAGVPPPEILAKSEFLRPLTITALEDYKWLIANMEKPGRSLINDVRQYILSVVSNFVSQPQSR